MSDSAQNEAQTALKLCARVAAMLAAAFIIVAREGFGPPYFDALGKALFWTDIVFLPLIPLNQDVLRMSEEKIMAVALFALHLIFILSSFGKLKDVTFIVLTPICFVQCLLYMLVLMLVRKRHTGIWY